MVIQILLKETLGRVIRLSGQVKLMEEACHYCDFIPVLDRDINESIDRIEKMMEMVNQYANVARNKEHKMEVRGEDQDTD